ncbi:MAG: hypothetical protein JF591_05600 [Lysobacter sp.]|nr:hypothetical protein [Lysobacter sp.]
MTDPDVSAMREVDLPAVDGNRRKNRVYTDCIIDAFHCRNVDRRVCGMFEPLLRGGCASDARATIDRGRPTPGQPPD